MDFIDFLGILVLMGFAFILGKMLKRGEPIGDFMEFDFEDKELEDKKNGKNNISKRSSKKT